MCLLSSVALRFDSILNEASWLAYLDLKLVAVNPTYVSILLPQVTVARYTMSLARHSPSRGHVAIVWPGLYMDLCTLLRVSQSDIMVQEITGRINLLIMILISAQLLNMFKLCKL